MAGDRSAEPEPPLGSGPDRAPRLRALVEEQLDGPLREAVAQTDLRREVFLEEALEAEGEIRDEAGAQQAAVDEAWVRARGARHGQRQLALILAGTAIPAGIGLTFVSGVLGGLLIVFGSAVPALFLIASFLRGDSALRRGTFGDEIRISEREYDSALATAVAAWISERANRDLGEIYDTALPEVDAQGLAEIDDGDSEISTATETELESMIEGMPAGSIGISGPRGAGKSTLLRRVTAEARRRAPERVAIGLAVDAPVDYDVRDFVLHLFARICEEVLGPERVEALRGWDRGFGGGGMARRPPGPFARLLPRQLGPLLLLGGVALYVAARYARDEIHLAALDRLALLIAAVGLVITYLTFLGPSELRRFLLAARSPARDLRERAELHLRQIWFQRTFSSGWSGSLKLPVGIEAGGERGTQLAENQLSLPDIVRLYKQFVSRLAEDGEVRIGIDELDKMDDERARRFLNEIKMIFRVSGCFYLVSVSEDAMSYFERRGLPFRDVFDSSFDDVMRVGYLPYRDSHRVLRRRVVGLPIQFVALCHVLGGGLARDVIRVARDVCEQPTGATIAVVTAELCVDQLRDKCAAGQVAVRRLDDPRQMTLLSRWLSRVDAAAADRDALLKLVRSFRDDVVSVLGRAPEGAPEALAEHREALSIALEIVTFTYFVVTLRDFLPGITDEVMMKAAIANSAIDRLAEARQAFAVNPGQAWEAISDAREQQLGGIGTVELPSLRKPFERSEPADDSLAPQIRQTADP
jgi:KAP family P-loop domain